MAFVVARLGLDLAVDYPRGAINGTETLVLRNVSSRAAATIPLLVNRLMVVADARTSDGAPLRFDQRVRLFQDDSSRQVNAIVLTPRRPVLPGQAIAIAIRYGGILVGYPETGSLYIRDQVSRDFTIIREDAYAFPVLGVLSERLNRLAPRESFRFTARITVPSDLVVATGGERQDPIRRDSLVTWTFVGNEPVPFLNITIAPYRLLAQPNARIYFFPADSAGALMVAQAITSTVDRFSRWYGALAPHPPLVVMEIPEGFGSQASLAAGILQTAGAFGDRAQLRQLYHELSHRWNVPDLDRPSPRWNEGFASFTEYRLAAELDGWSDWNDVLRRALESAAGPCGGASSRCESIPFEAYGRAGLTDRSYSVGLLLFYLEYRVLGDEAFDRGYRDFFQRHRDRGGSLADLVAAFEQASSASRPIFDQWLYPTDWRRLLSSGTTVDQIIEGYRQSSGDRARHRADRPEPSRVMDSPAPVADSAGFSWRSRG